MGIYIGTSGYYYKTWRKRFYPTSVRDFLQYYSQFFPSVEINASFYRIFKPDFYKKLIDRVPDDFKFVIKVHQNITHVRGDYYRDEIKKFNRSVKPLIRNDKYGCLLLQFPFSFKYSKENMNYLEKLIKYLPVKKAVEFRHDS